MKKNFKNIKSRNYPNAQQDPFGASGENLHDFNTSENVSNATALANHFIPGVNHLVDLKIIVEGKKLRNFKNFELKQSTKTHHSFVLELSHDALGDAENYHMEQAQDLLGKRILVTFNFKNIKEKPERDFIGVITEVSFKQNHGSRGYIVLTGASPTILLDGAPHIQSFGGSTPIPLSAVVQQILNEGYSNNNKYQAKIQSYNNYNISYACQYNETHYNFLARMAESYGEQFFYNGETLYFGAIPRIERAIELVYGREVEDIQIRMQARHINRNLYGYNSLNNERLSSGGDTRLPIKGTLAKAAYKKSERIFTTPSLQLAPLKASTNKDIELSQRGVIGSEAMHVFVTSGVTTVPFLYPGCIVELSMLKPGMKKGSFFTKLMITEIHHSVDALGHYKGQFEAVDADTGFIPRIAFNTPIAEQQIATVISNTDPQNRGRVQVQFDWQSANLNTEFIRMMSPDAGGTDKISQNRGYVAIPEVGDQVMVGFAHNHPDRPFVMGGMFHGGTALGGGINNHMRSIQTKSGIKVLMNDNEGSVNIIDPSGNTYFMDGQGNISVTAPKNMTLNAGENLNINVGQNMTSTIGMNKSDSIGLNNTESVGAIKNVTVGGNFITNVIGTMMELIKGNKESHTEKDRIRIAKEGITVQTEGKYEQHSKKEIQNNSGEKSKNH